MSKDEQIQALQDELQAEKEVRKGNDETISKLRKELSDSNSEAFRYKTAFEMLVKQISK